MICRSLIPRSVAEAVESLKKIEFAEVRLEQMKLSEADIQTLFNCSTKIIATNRPSGQSEDERREVLDLAIKYGASYVDIEIESSKDFKRELVALAKEKGCRVIVSYHNYTDTPDRISLQEIVDQCFDDGADIAKIACMVNTSADAARILGMLDSDRSVVAIGMGIKGRITRAAAPLLGSPFTFAPADDLHPTAPGQLTAFELEQIYRFF
jgi:3-dehydroquinate dehydratase type I